MKNIIYVTIAIFILGGVYFYISNNKKGTSSEYKVIESTDRKENVYLENGKQIIEIYVRGGYSPILSSAKKGIPTVIRFKTKGTFDCSSSILIPSLKINEVLQNTGVKDIDIGTPNIDKLSGTCSMGMYRFEIDFIK